MDANKNDNINNVISTQPDSSSEIENIVSVALPPTFLKCSRSDLVALIARMLTFLIEINDLVANCKTNENDSPYPPINRDSATVKNLTRFHSRTPPNISVYNYLIRLTKYSSLEHSVLLSSLYYIDLLSSVYPEFKINSLTVHRFLLTATTIASKGLCDSFCTNSHYSKVGGVQCSELNILETEFLRRVNYRIIPRDDNIKLCKLEQQQFKFTIEKEDLILSNIQLQSTHMNSGFNILDIYYHKIVQLVGSYSASTDKSKKVNYVLFNPIQNRVEQTTTANLVKSVKNSNSDNNLMTTSEILLPLKRNYENIEEKDKHLLFEESTTKIHKYSTEQTSKHNDSNTP